MASYEVNQPIENIEEIAHAFRQKTGDKYKYNISPAGKASKISGLFGVNHEKMMIRQNAYHGIELYFQQKDGRQFISTATVTPNPFLGAVLGRVGLLDMLIARTIFGSRKQLDADVNDVITGSFPVTVLDTSITGAIRNMMGKK